jgi:dihydropteroate synthase
MAILNLTGDSFYDGGKYLHLTEKELLYQVEAMLLQGADFIDIGGMSSRPGAEIINREDELKRVLPAVKSILQHFPDCIISIDTLHASVAEQCADSGAAVINDISAGLYDSAMIPTVGKLQIPYIMMHMQGLPNTMQQNPQYEDVVKEVMTFFAGRLEAASRHAIKDIVLDAGFGFGKTTEHNYTLLKNMGAFKHITGKPVLAGISRKSMICKVLQVSPANALNGTTAAHMLALQHGAAILRVHDVKEAMEVIKIFNAYNMA